MWPEVGVGRSDRKGIWVLSVAQWLDKKTLSSLEKDRFGRLLDHVYCQPKSCFV
jgi:hypothetical protein